MTLLFRRLSRLAAGMCMVAATGTVLAGATGVQEAHKPPAVPDKIAGVYSFVSETISIVSPKKRVELYDSSQWEGLWLFHNGFFSETLMKVERSIYDSGKKQSAREAGFIARAGQYRVNGGELNLVENISVFPGAVKRPRTFRYRFDEDTLTLIEDLLPRTESLASGTRTIVLRRIKQ